MSGGPGVDAEWAHVRETAAASILGTLLNGDRPNDAKLVEAMAKLNTKRAPELKDIPTIVVPPDFSDDRHFRECRPMIDQGNRLKKFGNLEGALGAYKAAVRHILGDGFEVPLYFAEGGGMRSKKYIDLKDASRLTLMACYNHIGSALMKMSKMEEALLWLDEVNILSKNMALRQQKPQFDWIDYQIKHKSLYYERNRALSIAAEIFQQLGNTAAAHHRRNVCMSIMHWIPDDVDDDLPEETLNVQQYRAVCALRHPDPNLSDKVTLQYPNLQILGSWQKIDLPKGGNGPARMGMCSFVWNSRFYVVCGEKTALGPYYNDVQYVDLQKLDGWQTLKATYPGPDMRMTGWYMEVYEDKAYLMNGYQDPYYIDLRTEKWGRLRTKWVKNGDDCPSSWPIPGANLTECAAVAHKGKLYLFGGTHGKFHVGINIFLELNLATKEWHKLSGIAGPLKADFSCPGPRRHPAMWLNKKEERIYVLYGESDLASAGLMKEEHGAGRSYSCEDFWSYDINEGAWRRERVVGNVPSPRSEMALTYNEMLDKVIVFGGYCPVQPSSNTETGENFNFTYFGDTFLFDPSSASSSTSRKWRHVLTRGFPTYRAQAKFVTDPATGKIFLFGGYTNTDFVPHRRQGKAKSFGDLWQLKLDLPGGCFEGVDLEEEAKTAKVGPWQRCYNCGSAGPWRKCGGTCGGRAFFCDPQCFKDGWKEHKQNHGCTKR